MLDDDDDHVYSAAWCYEDNKGYDPTSDVEPRWYRVFRYYPRRMNQPVTEPMSRAEAEAKCVEIIKVTGGRGI
jgi:hypothetical protein